MILNNSALLGASGRYQLDLQCVVGRCATSRVDYIAGSPVVIGREKELSLVNNYLADTQNGQCRLVLIDGDAGIGKTRFAREVAATAAEQGWRVFEGACLETDHALPYAPFVDVLRSVFSTGKRDAFLGSVGEVGEDIVPLVPEWAVAAQQAPDQQRIFRSFGTLFDTLARDIPTLVVLEDLHWSDDSSLGLIHHLTRRRGFPQAILATYRQDSMNPALRHFLAECDRMHLAFDLLLQPLDADARKSLVRILAPDQTLDASTRDRILDLADGNPFFIEELLKATRSNGPHSLVPRSVDDAIARRLDRLSAGARATAVVAAVAGRRVDPVIVEAVANVDEDTLVEQVQELVDAKILADIANQLQFRHALTREAVYGSVSSLERQRLHRRVAQAIEREYSHILDRYLVELTNHWYLARDWMRTLELAIQIGDRALRLGTPRAAFDCFTRAIEAAEQLGQSPPAGVLRSRGQAAEVLGLFDTTLGDTECALRLARNAADSILEWQCLIDLGYLWSSRDYQKTGEYFVAALRIAREVGDTATLTRSLNRVGNWLVNSGQPGRSLDHHQEALALAETLGDQAILAETLDLYAMASAEYGDMPGLLRYGRRAAALFRELRDLHGLSSILATLSGLDVHPEGETVPNGFISEAEAMAFVGEAITAAREIGWQAGEAYALQSRGNCLAMHGRFSDALRDLNESLTLAESIEHRQWQAAALLSLGWVHGLCLSPHAGSYLERAAAMAHEVGSAIFLTHANAGMARFALDQKRISDAAHLLTNCVIHEDGEIVIGPMLGDRGLWCVRGELAVAQGNPDLALRIVAGLTAMFPASRSPIPRLDRLRGEALMLQRRWDEAESALHGAVHEAVRLNMPVEVWRGRFSLGRLYAMSGQPDRAQDAYNVARAVVDSLIPHVPPEYRDGYVRGMSAQFPPRPVMTQRRQAKQTYDGLTQRECDVALLVAKGKTNRDIAEDLVLSERTVSTHITNILSKLGFRSRSQIASWAVRKGLS